jgi:1-acyl-sn-glycerol-3-phosphate acyltransferase/membrane-associated phospholipid phosphatase
MTRRAACHSAALSLLFLLVYGGCNWFASRRTDVGTWFFEWERHIPFLSWMIVPYLSIDAFFVSAPFLFRDCRELRVYSSRMTAAILVGGFFFLLFPLRFGFERPLAEGLSGALVRAFTSVDRPFNLLPSLHVTLAVILADAYGRHSRGVVRAALTAWFVLVVSSTVFVYQHHIVDVAGGMLLAGFVFYAVPWSVARRSSTSNLRIATYYVVGALLVGAAAAVAVPWTAVLLWPAMALAVSGAAYLGGGPAVFRKSTGRITASAWMFLWPCLLGHWLSHIYYRRHCRPYDELLPNVWIGRRLDAREAAMAVERGVAAILDLSAELDEVTAFRRLRYKGLPILDLTAPTMDQLDEGVRFIRAHTRRGIVYVHCKIGYSRTAAVAAAYLLATGIVRTADEALARLRRVRPSIVVRPEAERAIRQFESRLLGRRLRWSAGPSIPTAIFSALAAGAARLTCGPPRWEGWSSSSAQRIYFANHTSHLDFPLLWGSLPPDVRLRTRPVAGLDYWNRGVVRRYLARRVFRMVLVKRGGSSTDRDAAVDLARRSVERAARALATGASLIIFPEGTRGGGEEVQPFKSGLYHLCKLRPDVELVPVFLENFHRILPKGEAIPLPIAGSVTFGRPIRLLPGEDKQAFLARARTALVMARSSCSCLPIPISRAS